MMAYIEDMEMRVSLIEKAKAFAFAKHDGQTRKYTGEPYIIHPLAVGELVASIGEPDAVVAAAILHDTLEDTKTTEAELVAEFGPEVAGLVVELTDVFVAGTGGNHEIRKAKECARLATVSAAAQTIKVADIIDNTGSIVERDPEFAKVYLKEKAALLAVLTKAAPALLAKAKETI
jgi:guanosine-3',5'-bis(diphosphate) 3'-pyrophosphohydrolase